jgi:hypothetical protein
MGPTASLPRVVAFRETARPDLARSSLLVASAFAQHRSSEPPRGDDLYATNAIAAGGANRAA